MIRFYYKIFYWSFILTTIIACDENVSTNKPTIINVVVNEISYSHFINTYPVISKNSFAEGNCIYIPGSFTKLDSSELIFNLLQVDHENASLIRENIASYIGPETVVPTNAVLKLKNEIVLTSVFSGIKFISGEGSSSRWMNLYGSLQKSICVFENGLLVGTEGGKIVNVNEYTEAVESYFEGESIVSVKYANNAIYLISQKQNKKYLKILRKGTYETEKIIELSNTVSEIVLTDEKELYLVGQNQILELVGNNVLKKIEAISQFDFINVKSRDNIIFMLHDNVYHYNGEEINLLYSFDAENHFTIYSSYLDNYFLVFYLNDANKGLSIVHLKLGEK